MNAPAPAAPAPSSTPAATPTSSTPSTPVAKSPPGPDTFKSEVAPSTETPQQKAARKLKLKVDGQEREIDINSMPDEQLALKLQMAEAASKRMEEAATQRKQLNKIVEAFKKGDFSILKDPAIGIDVRKMVEDQIIEEYNAKQLPEADRVKAEYEKQLRERDEKIKEYETAQQKIAREQLEAKTLSEIETEFTAALQSRELPQTRETMALMADVAATYLEKYGVSLTPQQLAAEVDNKIQAQAKYVLSQLKGEQLVKYLGQDVVNSLVKMSVEKYRSASTTPKPEVPVQKEIALPKGASSLFDEETKTARKMSSMKDFARLKKGL